MWKRLVLVLLLGCQYNSQKGGWSCSCKNSRFVEPAMTQEQQELDAIEDMIEEHIGFSS